MGKWGVNKAYDEKSTIPPVKNGGGSLMFWECVSYHGSGNPVRIDGLITTDVQHPNSLK